MRWNTLRAALLIGMVALTSEVAATEPGTDAAKINAILDRWQVVEASKGGDVALWRDVIGIQLKMVSPGTLEKLLALNTGPSAQTAAEFYHGFIYTLGADIALRLQAKKAQAKARVPVGAKISGSDATTVGRVETKSLGDFGDDQTFTPITPCRVVDTRNVGGKIPSFAARNFFYFTTSASTNWFSLQGGVNGPAGTVCPGTVIASGFPSAAVATVIVTGQGGAGNLILWQGNNPVASADTISYPASGDTSTLADIPWGARIGSGPGGAIEDFGVFVNAFSATNVVVDIVGYYSQPAATALDCVYLSNTGVGTGDWPSGTIFFIYHPTCPVGYSLTGTGCTNVTALFGPNVYLVENSPATFGYCHWFNSSGFTGNSLDLRAESVCCRIYGH